MTGPRVSCRCRKCGWAGRGYEQKVKLVIAAHVLLCHPEVWVLDARPGEEEEVLGKLSWRDLEVAIARR